MNAILSILSLSTNWRKAATELSALMMLAVVSACTSTASHPEEEEAVSLPVFKVVASTASTHRDYSASLEGTVNVEIRPQVDGYLERIHVDEGAYVEKGQLLFQINDRVYREQLSDAQASLLTAQANLEKAEVELRELGPLVENNVVSEVELQTAKAAYRAQQANVEQAKARVGNARINLDFTRITAPVSGYIGRIPFKAGSLVGRGETQALTVLSEVDEMYAYFSMGEEDFLKFKEEMPGKTIQEKLGQMPEVELVLSDGNLHPYKGRIETMEGQFDRTMGAISFRATFPNPGGLLRSGNTGRVRITRQHENVVLVPQEATFELQDRVFVYTLSDSNTVNSTPIRVSGKSGPYYLLENGLRPGQSIVYAGFGQLQEGDVIQPRLLAPDSLASNL